MRGASRWCSLLNGLGWLPLCGKSPWFPFFCERLIWMAKLTKQEKNLLKNKLEYLKLAYRISVYRLSGEEAPEELLKKARATRISADFSKEEMENVLKCWALSIAYWPSLPVYWSPLLSGFNWSVSIKMTKKILITALTFILFFLAYASSAPF